MGLSLQEIKELVSFGHALGLQQLQAEGVTVVYGFPTLPTMSTPESTQPQDDNTSKLPPELRHYSAQGKAALGKVG